MLGGRRPDDPDRSGRACGRRCILGRVRASVRPRDRGHRHHPRQCAGRGRRADHRQRHRRGRAGPHQRSRDLVRGRLRELPLSRRSASGWKACRTPSTRPRPVARNILGHGEDYVPHPWFWSDQYDVKLQIAGLKHRIHRCRGARRRRCAVALVLRGRHAGVGGRDERSARLHGGQAPDRGRANPPRGMPWRTPRPTSRRCCAHEGRLRIVGGRWRGRVLADLGQGHPEAHLRPTTDRVRESLFNLLTNGRWGDLVTGARVLDLVRGDRGAGARSAVAGGGACDLR